MLMLTLPEMAAATVAYFMSYLQPENAAQLQLELQPVHVVASLISWHLGSWIDSLASLGFKGHASHQSTALHAQLHDSPFHLMLESCSLVPCSAGKQM